MASPTRSRFHVKILEPETLEHDNQIPKLDAAGVAKRRPKRKRTRWLLLLMLLVPELVSVARHPFAPPAFDRHGEYMFLTKNYRSTAVHFSLLGKRLINQDSGKFQLFPSPTTLFPGIPLMLFENAVVCPLIDVALLPADLWRNVVSRIPSHIRENGFHVQVMDVFGRPVSGVEVRVAHCNVNELPVIYNGHRRKNPHVRGITDGHGELFVPMDMTTVNYLTPSVSSAGECDKGKLRSTSYRPGYRHPPFNSECRDRFYKLLPDDDVENPDLTFPQRDKGHVFRVVLEPDLTGTYDMEQWSFVPEKGDVIRRRKNWKMWALEDLSEYENITDMGE